MTCPTCDRPRATATERAHVGGCTCAACLAACWGPPCEPADWRAMVARYRDACDADHTFAAVLDLLDALAPDSTATITPEWIAAAREEVADATRTIAALRVALDTTTTTKG